jgi:hypothetical protein
MRPYLQITTAKRVGGMVQAVECKSLWVHTLAPPKTGKEKDKSQNLEVVKRLMRYVRFIGPEWKDRDIQLAFASKQTTFYLLVLNSNHYIMSLNFVNQDF